MTSVVFVCAVLLLAAAVHATNIIKGLYCQDPDTGNLYPVNSTWPSQSFCGNYTCKLRKKNITETEYTPMQRIDITQLRIPNGKDIANDMAISSSDKTVLVTKKTDSDVRPIFHKKIHKPNSKDAIGSSKDVNDKDGYLTEAEIKTITDMLHTVKKSDLEAIVDIYNLAQEIYKEIDNDDNDNLIKDKESKNTRKLGKFDKIKDQQSYWYDPAQYNNKLVDISREKSNAMPKTKRPIDSNLNFFTGPLSDKDFRKLPYYYPISNFQRLSSYTHAKQNINDLEKATTEIKPCTKNVNNYNVPLHEYIAPVKKPDPPQTVRPSTLLPYPFSYIYHYNISGYPPNYYQSYPWAHVDYSRHRNYGQPYYGAYILQIPNSIPSISPHSKSNSARKQKSSETVNSGERLDTFKKSTTEKKLPDWQTEPLSEKVIDEVRAHLEKPRSLKPIPLKKNIKLERVGKVIKLDELTRSKREVEGDDIENNINETYVDELEAYIERIVCENSIEPGYFSMGNMSQPYPACCPRKLESLRTSTKAINTD